MSMTFMSPKQAAAYLGLSPKTLEKYRHTGEGPAYYRMGRSPRYTLSDLDAWVTGSGPFNSIAEETDLNDCA